MSQNLLNGTTVYLAGGVENASDGGITWRNSITPRLKSLGIKVWNPLIKPEWFVNHVGEEITAESQINSRELFKKLVTYGDKFKCKSQILEEEKSINYKKAWCANDYLRKVCLRLARSCDFIICKLGVSIGTQEEIKESWDKPILFIGEMDSSWRFSQFYKHEPMFFPSEDDVMEYLWNINDHGRSMVLNNINWIFLDDIWPS